MSVPDEWSVSWKTGPDNSHSKRAISQDSGPKKRYKVNISGFDELWSQSNFLVVKSSFSDIEQPHNKRSHLCFASVAKDAA